jgi:23S rRNA pseudouridine2605 synthase
MERKAKSSQKKIKQEESISSNKNFYGKKVEKLVGFNKNKEVKKWQPNDDLNELIPADALEFNDFKKGKAINSTKKFSNSENKYNDLRDKKKYVESKEIKPVFKKTLSANFKEQNENSEKNFEIPPSSSAKNRTYKEYKSKASKFNSNNEAYQETGFKNKKTIFEKPVSKSKINSNTSYKPKLKPEKKGPLTARLAANPNDDTIRLNKFISNAGVCSRREADELIKAGAVTVNGKVITEMGYKIQRTDLVNYGGQGLKPQKQIYILLNKPKDYITTSDDPQERRTVLELIKGACKERVYPVGRLDRNTTGLLLLTNDGELTDKITHPSFKQKKIYHVELDKPVKKEHLKAIEAGIELEDGHIKVDEINYVEDSDSKKEIGITLHSGRNRIVRRIFEHFDYKVKKLDRVYFAGLTKKDLARGRWRFLTPMEINMLKMVQ